MWEVVRTRSDSMWYMSKWRDRYVVWRNILEEREKDLHLYTHTWCVIISLLSTRVADLSQVYCFTVRTHSPVILSWSRSSRGSLLVIVILPCPVRKNRDSSGCGKPLMLMYSIVPVVMTKPPCIKPNIIQSRHNQEYRNHKEFEIYNQIFGWLHRTINY